MSSAPRPTSWLALSIACWMRRLPSPQAPARSLITSRRWQPAAHDRVHQVGERQSQPVGLARTRPRGLGTQADEERRQLVEEDQRRLVAEDVGPGRRAGTSVERCQRCSHPSSAEQRDPEILGGVRLAAAEGGDPDRPVVDGDADPLENGLALGWLAREQRRRQQVVGLAAAHGLLEAEHALVAPPHQALEDLPQEDGHALGDVRLGKNARASSCR